MLWGVFFCPINFKAVSFDTFILFICYAAVLPSPVPVSNYTPLIKCLSE